MCHKLNKQNFKDLQRLQYFIKKKLDENKIEESTSQNLATDLTVIPKSTAIQSTFTFPDSLDEKLSSNPKINDNLAKIQEIEQNFNLNNGYVTLEKSKNDEKPFPKAVIMMERETDDTTMSGCHYTKKQIMNVTNQTESQQIITAADIAFELCNMQKMVTAYTMPSKQQ